MISPITLHAIDWLLVPVIAPLLGAIVGFVLPRAAAAAGLAGLGLSAAAAAAITGMVLADGVQATAMGGWEAPLGIVLAADGLTAAFLLLTAVLTLAIGSARALGRAPVRGAAIFWPLMLLLVAGLNGAFLSTDIFNIYVTLEVAALAAVGLAVLSGSAAALRAALNYLLAGMLGGVLILLGIGLLYHAHGRLDLGGLADVVGSAPNDPIAMIAILAGLTLKAALFPLHAWLPAAHSNAQAPVSALLSALVLKAPLYVALRLWVGVFEPSTASGTVLGLMGAGAILWGSVQALRAERLKLLVAYSTVAQVGLISLAFGLSAANPAAIAWTGAVTLMLAHGLAKAAMFMAAGRIVEETGHDRIADLDRSGRRPTLAQFSFALAAISLIGLPPTLGFAGKWQLMEGAVRADAWIWVAMAMAGTLLSVGYLSRVLVGFLRFDRVRGAVGEHQGWTLADGPPLLLALAAFGAGLFATHIIALLAAGAPLGQLSGTMP
jgi:formate hydrogenlyase subunit 3/multisubunit Na+/H+ antiporter MnhD subunit